MIEYIIANQLNIMLMLCGCCGIIAFLLRVTRFIPASKKRALQLMEYLAFFLLWFDRLAYIYDGMEGSYANTMVKLSNFMVFFLTASILLGFNIYLKDLLANECKLKTLPRRIQAVQYMAYIAIFMTVVSHFTGLYYYIDEKNVYHRGDLFLLAYVFPLFGSIIQYTIIRQYKNYFSKIIYYSLALYIFVPVLGGVQQFIFYGISVLNIEMAVVSILLYVFTYLDVNNKVANSHEREIQNMQVEKEKIQKLFAQTAMAFVSAVEKKDDFIKGNAARVAKYAKRIAELSGKTPYECEEAYFAALLHDVGIIGIPDEIVKNEADLGEEEYAVIKNKPLIGSEILSNITEYPYLETGAHYSHERYNGTGYPEGLKGEDIPEIARIIAVADAYVAMTSKNRYREAKPSFVVREAFIKGSGEQFDPKFADIMVKIIDEEAGEKSVREVEKPETELLCGEYRQQTSYGIPVEDSPTVVSFDFKPTLHDEDREFSMPSVILFDSYDNRVHDNEKAIAAYRYTEYGEFWFDEHSISTNARKIEEKCVKRKNKGGKKAGYKYEITMSRYEDHLRLKMVSPSYEKDTIVALPSGSKSAILALTGEHCVLRNISVKKSDKKVKPDDIPRIANEIKYTDRMEADVKNIQINRKRSASTVGVELKDRLRITFHSMSLPGADLVWHCPYLVLFYSDDGTVKGKNYREYALIKLYGENEGTMEYADNSIKVKKTEGFPGWDAWKGRNKKGVEYQVSLKRNDNRIITMASNLGIELENKTTIKEAPTKVFAALTGDQVAITDIRVI